MHNVHRLPVAAVAALALATSTSCSKPKADSGDGGSASGSASSEAPSGAGPLAGASLSMLTSGFEGEIDAFTQKAGGAQTPLTVFLKGDKVRFELPEDLAKNAGQFLGEKAYGILDSAAKKLYVVSDAKKQAILIDLNSGKPLGSFGPHAHGPGGSPATPPSKITKTGKYDTVAGYKCENWDIASDHDGTSPASPERGQHLKEGTICVAQQGVSWLSLPLSAIPSERAWAAELVDGHHFPLRFIGYQKDGTTEETRVEVTKIDKKSLQDSEFQVPPGYNVMDLEKMFAGIPGMPPGMAMPPGFPSGGFPPGRPHGMPH
jgi:hypothetical protein